MKPKYETDYHRKGQRKHYEGKTKYGKDTYVPEYHRDTKVYKSYEEKPRYPYQKMYQHQPYSKLEYYPEYQEESVKYREPQMKYGKHYTEKKSDYNNYGIKYFI